MTSPIALVQKDLLHSFFTESEELFYKMSADWQTMEVLAGNELLSGTDPSDNNWIEHIIPQEDRSLLRKTIAYSIDQKAVFRLDHRIVSAGGHIIPVRSKAFPVNNQSGDIDYWYGTMRRVPEAARPLLDWRDHQAEGKYRVLFNSMDQGYCIIRMLYNAHGQPVDWLFVEVNPAFERHNGLVGATGKTMRELNPAIEQKWMDIYNSVAATGESIRFEEDSEALDRVFDLYAFRIGLPEDPLVAVLFTDVTERRNAEKKQSFQLMLQDILRSLTDPGEIQEQAAKILGVQLDVSRAFYFSVAKEQDGYSHIVTRDFYNHPDMPSVVGSHPLEVYGKTIYAGLQEGKVMAIADLSRHSEVKAAELEKHLALGVRSLIIVPLIKNGEYVAAFAVNDERPRNWTGLEIQLVEETAERTWAAVERASTQAELKASQSLLASVFRVSPIGIGYADNQGKYLIQNEHMRRFIPGGMMPSKDKSADWRWIAVDGEGARLPPEEYPGVKALRGDTSGTAIEMLHILEDGSEIWTRVAAIALYEDDGTPNGIVVVITDIDDLKRTTEKLTESEQQLKELIRQKDEFIAIASHELKTPVTSMMIYAEVALESFRRNGQLQESSMLERLLKQIHRLTALIYNLLDTTKIVGGQLKLSPLPTDLHQLLQERIEEIATSSSHHFELTGDDLPLIKADQERLGQVITNLLTNAVKYSPENTRIKVVTELQGGEVWVHVADEGYGINEADQQHVFGQYYRVSAEHIQVQQGIGLGLYIAAEIIQRHGGAIRVKSTPGKGSVFSFSLPLD